MPRRIPPLVSCTVSKTLGLFALPLPGKHNASIAPCSSGKEESSSVSDLLTIARLPRPQTSISFALAHLHASLFEAQLKPANTSWHSHWQHHQIVCPSQRTSLPSIQYLIVHPHTRTHIHHALYKHSRLVSGTGEGDTLDDTRKLVERSMAASLVSTKGGSGLGDGTAGRRFLNTAKHIWMDASGLKCRADCRTLSLTCRVLAFCTDLDRPLRTRNPGLQSLALVAKLPRQPCHGQPRARQLISADRRHRPAPDLATRA